MNMDIILKNSPIFVVGTGRCGTTLLTDLIQGKQIHCLKERQVLSRIREFDNQHIFNLLYRGDIEEQVFLKFFRAVRVEILKRYRGDEIYCEKIPHGQWAMKSIKKVFPQAKFMEIFREGKDTVQSMMNAGWYALHDTRPRWLPRGDLGSWDALSQHEKCCTRLTHTIRFTVDNILTSSKKDYLAFSYEELMADLEKMLKRMEDFIGTNFFRGKVTLKPSLENWKKWSHNQIDTYYKILGETGVRDQVFLGYGEPNAIDSKGSDTSRNYSLYNFKKVGFHYSGTRHCNDVNNFTNKMTRANVSDLNKKIYSSIKHIEGMGKLKKRADVNIFMLIKDRKEFTNLALKFLYDFTDFSLVHSLVFVNDCSADGADEVCHSWIKKTGIGEVVNITGGTVTNALFSGTEPYIDYSVKYMVKLDNDIILSEDWLNKIYTQAEHHYFMYDIFGFTTTNEFFPSTPEELWTQRPPEQYSLTTVPYSGGNFLMKWDFFKRFRHLGVVKNPAHYISGSLSEVHRLMSSRGLLRIAIINPHLPVFKLDKAADNKYKHYKFFEKRGIDKERIEELIENYYLKGMCRKRLVNGKITNIHQIKDQTILGRKPDGKYLKRTKLLTNDCYHQLSDKEERTKHEGIGRKFVCISGMHRSGTSMVSHLLILCGLYTGPDNKIIPARSDNPAGFWENIDFLNLNDQILAHLGGGWDFFPLSVKEGWELEATLNPLRNKALEFTKTFINRKLCGWKDPRSSLTMPFWKNLFPGLKIVFCVRNPLEVALSLQKRNYSSIPFGLNLWQIYNLRLMADTCPEDRVVTHYEAYFVDPEKELRRVLDSLGLAVSEVKLQKACSTISRKLRHNRFSKQDIFKAGASPELLELYDDLCAESGPIFQTALVGKVFALTQPEPPQRITSIIILTHNQLKYTKKCIESIIKETKEPFELIIVDNGSTDGTIMYLEKLVRSYETDTVDSKQNTKAVTQKNKKKTKKKAKKVKLLNKSCRTVRLIKNDENLGFAAGNNQGMALAKGDYILLINNDVVVTPNWLKHMISCAERSPETGIVGPMSNYVSGPQLVKQVNYDTNSLARLNKFSKEFSEKNSDQGKLIWRVVGFCMLIKRAVIDKIGGMDERYGLGNFEDDDFSLRAALAGFESWIAEDCFVHHYGSRTFIGAKIDYHKSLQEKWEIFKKKWGMSQDLPYGSTYDFSQIAKNVFIKKKHYCPLTQKGSPTIKEKEGSLYLPEGGQEHGLKIKLKAADKSITASIIIPVSKKKNHLRRCIESIQKNTYEPFELIFIKNGSKSITLKWLRQLVGGNSKYQTVDCGKNASIAKFFNEGIKASSGKYIVLLHSDAVVTEGWLSVMLECMSGNSDAGIVGPMTNNTIGIQKVSDADSISIDHLEDYAKTFREKYRYRRVPISAVNNFCMLLRRDLVEKIGLLDENLGFDNTENEDFCLRTTLEGYKILIAADVFIYTHSGKNQSIIRKAFSEKWRGISAQTSLGKKLLASKALEKATELDERGQIEKAAKVLFEGMKHAPNHAILKYAIPEMVINSKQFNDAFDIINEMQLDDQDVKKLALIGYCMEGMERYDEAEDYTDRALSLDSASALALNLKGILSFRKGDKVNAESFFRRAIDSDPSYGEPYTNLATLKWDKDVEGALNLYEKGFVLSPINMDNATIYHSAVTSLGRFKRAEPVFKDSCVLHPNNRRLKFLLIDILVQQGKHDLAMKEIEDAMIAFGIDDGILSAANKVRNGLGPMKIANSSGNRGSLSLCMIVKNEEQHLAKCLRSVKPVVDEMIVVDTGSIDRTKDIAKAFGAKVFDFKWTNDFSEARNFSISKASGDWILVMDADEMISPMDCDSLREIVRKSSLKSVAYLFETRNYTVRANTVGWIPNNGTYEEEAGKGWHPSNKVRLFSNDSRIKFVNPVHELVEPSLRRLGIKINECGIPVHHYGKLNAQKVASKGEDYYLLGKAKLKGKMDDIQSLTELAIQAQELGKYEDALELWQKVIAIRPDNKRALLNIGGAFLKLGRYEDALRASKKAMALDNNLREAVLNYSSCELFIGNVEKSISALETLICKEPEYPSAIGMLSTAYFIKGEKEKGLKYINKIKRMGFNPSDYLYKRAKQFLSAGKTDYAILLLEIAVESNNKNRYVTSLLSECYSASEMAMGTVAIQSKNLESVSIPEISQ